MELKAGQKLSTIRTIIKEGERVELNAIKDAQNFGNSLNKLTESIKDLSEQEQKIFDEKHKQIQNGETISQKLKQELDNVFKKSFSKSSCK